MTHINSTNSPIINLQNLDLYSSDIIRLSKQEQLNDSLITFGIRYLDFLCYQLHTHSIKNRLVINGEANCLGNSPCHLFASSFLFSAISDKKTMPIESRQHRSIIQQFEKAANMRDFASLLECQYLIFPIHRY